jgi:hypothetical protein
MYTCGVWIDKEDKSLSLDIDFILGFNTMNWSNVKGI